MRISISNILLYLGLALFTSSLQAAHGGPDVKIDEIEVGQGLEALRFSVADVHYTGRLENGDVFDSSVERGGAYSFYPRRGPGDSGLGNGNPGDESRRQEDTGYPG